MPLEDVFQLLQTAGLLVAADGGLLHVGRAARVPVVGLFAGAIHPRMRFGRSEVAHVIHTASAVEKIAPEVIARAIHAHFQQAMTELTFEYLDDEPSHDEYRQMIDLSEPSKPSTPADPSC
jgi:ADP-heptose:LPS heptosyltransferase